MSYCAIVPFEEGKAVGEVEFRNAWLGAAYIWTSLFDKYLKDPNKEYDSWMTRNLFSKEEDRSLWNLAVRKDLPVFERAVHISTFDHAVVLKKNFKQFVDDLRQFAKTYPSNSHLNAWANYIEKCEAEAVGFYGTSISECLWFEDTDDESIPYDLNKNDKHYDVYQYIKECDEEESQ